ncbi:hypothetical protein BJF78_27155 [Pseudonocardia sp. CNS-139]|nr:hypothetical protein BJF78_27155 [Pseudonocardia sp. CNS-139]
MVEHLAQGPCSRMVPCSIQMAVSHRSARNSSEWEANTRMPERSTSSLRRSRAFARNSESTAPMPSSSSRISGSMLVTTPSASRTRMPVEYVRRGIER